MARLEVALTANGYTGPNVGMGDVEGLQDALDAKLDEANGEVVDSTLAIRKSDNSSGLRLRSTGGAVDVDKMNGDIVVSSFAGPAYAGTQTGLQRWRSTGTTLAGLTEFGSTVYTGEQSIDASTGVANLGAKNSASNLGVCGFVAVDGPPVTGTWAVNDLVMTRTGFYRCITAGTPGTWTGNITGTPSPLDHSMAGWSFDPKSGAMGATLLPTAGLMHVAKVRAVSSVVTNILLHFTVGGSSLSNCFAVLYNEAGAKLGAGAITADLSTAWQSSGLKTCALVTPQGVTPGAVYRVAWWYNGTTAPTVSRGSASGSALINVNLSASTAWYATADTGRTNAASAPENLGTLSGDTTAWWVGLS